MHHLDAYGKMVRAPPTGLRIWTIAVHMCPNGQRRPPTGLRMWTIVRGGHLFSPNLAQVWSRFGEENGQGLSSPCPRLAQRLATPNHSSPAFVQRHRAPSAGSQWPPPPISVASSIGASPCCAALAVVLGRPPPPPPSAVRRRPRRFATTTAAASAVHCPEGVRRKVCENSVHVLFNK